MVLAGLRLEALKRTPVYQKHLAQLQIPQIDGFAALTGIDPKNLWELLYVSNSQRGAVIGHGKFSDEGEPKLQKRGDERFAYKGFTLMGGDTNAILLVNQTVLAVGDTDELKAMVDAHEKVGRPSRGRWRRCWLACLPPRKPGLPYAGGPLKLPFDVTATLAISIR